jgi:hypothetical protein
VTGRELGRSQFYDSAKYLVIPLLQGLLSQPVPAFGTIDSVSSLHRDIEIATFNSQIESSVLILDEVEGDLDMRVY